MQANGLLTCALGTGRRLQDYTARRQGRFCPRVTMRAVNRITLYLSKPSVLLSYRFVDCVKIRSCWNLAIGVRDLCSLSLQSCVTQSLASRSHINLTSSHRRTSQFPRWPLQGLYRVWPTHVIGRAVGSVMTRDTI